MNSRQGRGAALHNAAWLLTDKLAALLLGLFTFGWIARAFGPTGSGHLGYGLALVQAALGLSLVASAAALLPRMVRLRLGFGGMVANVFVVRLIASVLAASATAVYALIAIDDPERLYVCLSLLLAVPLIEPFFTGSLYWQSRNDNRHPTASRILGLIARAAAVLFGLWLSVPLWVLALAWLAEAIVAAFAQRWSVRKLGSLHSLRKRVTPQRLRAYAGFGLRFMPGLWLGALFFRTDRLVLAELMTGHEYGLYASAMQLIDVWTQIAYLAGFAAGPAFLYATLQRQSSWRSLVPASLGLTAIGLVGVAGCALLGPWALQTVFGAAFERAAPWLLAGSAFAVLVFVDQVTQLAVTVANRPWALAFKWACACAVAVIVQRLGFAAWGAYSGPIGLAAGIVAGWLALATMKVIEKRHASSKARPLSLGAATLRSRGTS